MPITELTADGRYLLLRATAGSVTNNTIIYGPNTALGTCCLNVVSVVLNNVPGSVTSVAIEVDTRGYQNGQSVNGQSWVMAGALDVETVCNCVSPPSSPSVTNGARCGTGSVTLTASGCSGGTINWYSSALGGTILGTGTSFATPSISSTTTYYAGCTTGDCTSARVAVTASIVPIHTVSVSGGTSVCTGGSVTLTGTISGGAGTPSYQWQSSSDNTTFNNISGATSATYTTPSLTSATYYRVIGTMSAGCGSVTSASTVINITADPSISTHPSGNTICSGGTHSMSVVAAGGTPSLTYQWQSSPDGTTWTNISGAALNTYTTASLTATTHFRVVVSASGSGCESVNSNPAVVTVVADPSISTHPTSATICSGGTRSLTVIASGGTPSLTYQWQSSPDGTTWTNISGATTSNYTTPVLTTTTRYRVNVSASGTDCNTISSNPAIITVVAQHTASITGNQTICSGGTASFTATVSGGSGTITYQWQDSPDGTTWANISGATSSTFTTPALTGNTYYRVVVTRSASNCGSVNSTSSLVTVVADPAISTHPADVTICNGGSTSLSVTATGRHPFSDLSMGKQSGRYYLDTGVRCYQFNIFNRFSGCNNTIQSSRQCYRKRMCLCYVQSCYHYSGCSTNSFRNRKSNYL
ncbi:MAG: hypothetical protein IPL20_13465 [Saprospiraceae bacterium]|nr:hypothetical protein [Saprospiraceae bacterium]